MPPSKAYQTSLNANWVLRDRLDGLVRSPKMELVAVRFGVLESGRLNRLNSSLRNCGEAYLRELKPGEAWLRCLKAMTVRSKITWGSPKMHLELRPTFRHR